MLNSCSASGKGNGWFCWKYGSVWLVPSRRNDTWRDSVPLVDSLSEPGIVLPDSWSTAVSTMPATSVLSFAASRPFSGSSTIRLASTTSLSDEDVTSTVGDSPVTVTVSAMLLSSTVKLTVTYWSACSNTPLRSAVRNPLSSTVMSYVLGRSDVSV